MRRFLSGGFAFVGLVLASCAVAMVAIYGMTLGALWYEQLIYGLAHVAIHMFGMLAAFSIGVLLIDKRPWLALLVAVAVLAGGTYGITNMVGFAAHARLSVSEAVTVNNSRALEKFERLRADLIAQRNASEAKAMEMDRSRAERLGYRKQQADYQAKLNALEPPVATAQNVMPDGAAAVLSNVLPVGLHKLQWVLSVPVAVLSYLFEALSFFLCVRVWPRKEVDLAPLEGEDEIEVKLDPVKPIPLEPVAVEPAPSPSPKALPEQLRRLLDPMNPDDLPPPRRAIKGNIDALRDLTQIVLPACGSIPSQNFLARRWGTNRERASKWTRDFLRNGFIERQPMPGFQGGTRMQISAPRESDAYAAA